MLIKLNKPKGWEGNWLTDQKLTKLKKKCIWMQIFSYKTIIKKAGEHLEKDYNIQKKKKLANKQRQSVNVMLV